MEQCGCKEYLNPGPGKSQWFRDRRRAGEGLTPNALFMSRFSHLSAHIFGGTQFPDCAGAPLWLLRFFSRGLLSVVESTAWDSCFDLGTRCLDSVLGSLAFVWFFVTVSWPEIIGDLNRVSLVFNGMAQIQHIFFSQNFNFFLSNYFVHHNYFCRSSG